MTIEEERDRYKSALATIWFTCNDSFYRDPRAQVSVSWKAANAALRNLPSPFPNQETEDLQDWEEYIKDEVENT